METADTIFGILLLGGAFLAFTLMNYRVIFLTIKKAEYIPSMAPFIGGVAGAVLVTVSTGFKYPLLILLPLLIDPGSIPIVIRLVISLVRK